MTSPLCTECNFSFMYKPHCNKCRKCMLFFVMFFNNKTRQYRSSNLMSNITLHYVSTPVPIHLLYDITLSPTLYSNSSFSFSLFCVWSILYCSKALTSSMHTLVLPTHTHTQQSTIAPKIENSECNLKIFIQLFAGRGLGCSSYLHRFLKTKSFYQF